jgi:hypothetical protein
MNPPLNDNPDRDSDPLDAYADGDPDVVRAAAPREPSEAEWEAARLRIHARLDAAREPSPANHWRKGVWLAGAGVLSAAAAAVAWFALTLNAPRVQNPPREPGPAPAPDVAVAPHPHSPEPDPLAEYAVLPVASDDDVVLHRVPGDGMLPVGVHPLLGLLSLAAAEDVELDESNQPWPAVTPAPGDFPMIFAAKPR